jgi:hypothetical protein
LARELWALVDAIERFERGVGQRVRQLAAHRCQPRERVAQRRIVLERHARGDQLEQAAQLHHHQLAAPRRILL